MAEADPGAELALVNEWIVDTGPLVAFLDRGDRFHGLASQRLGGFRGRLHTTSPVVTECMHLLSETPEGPVVLAELVVRSGLEIHDYTQPPFLREAAALMKKYASVPMDFADATLVLLSESLDIANVATLDRRGFSVFRAHGRKPLRLVLDEPPS